MIQLRALWLSAERSQPSPRPQHTTKSHACAHTYTQTLSSAVAWCEGWSIIIHSGLGKSSQNRGPGPASVMMVGIYEAPQDLSLTIPSSIPAGVTHPAKPSESAPLGPAQRARFALSCISSRMGKCGCQQRFKEPVLFPLQSRLFPLDRRKQFPRNRKCFAAIMRPRIACPSKHLLGTYKAAWC